MHSRGEQREGSTLELLTPESPRDTSVVGVHPWNRLVRIIAHAAIVLHTGVYPPPLALLATQPRHLLLVPAVEEPGELTLCARVTTSGRGVGAVATDGSTLGEAALSHAVAGSAKLLHCVGMGNQPAGQISTVCAEPILIFGILRPVLLKGTYAGVHVTP